MPAVAGSAMPSEHHPGAYRVLLASTFAFMVCFAVWMMFGVIGIPIRQALGLSNTEFGLLTATPVLLGAVMRLPLGIWTDRFGGRIVMTVLLRELTIKGAIGYADDHPAAIRLVQDGKVDLAPFVTGRIAVEDVVEKGYRELIDHKDDHVKIVVSV